MEPAFWHQRWAAQQIGFHQAQVNPYLRNAWPELGLAVGSQVLVPLCGKSLDLLWLAEQGHRVLGVELSREAVAAFFEAHQLTPVVEPRGVFEVWRAGAIELWCGDFFALTENDLHGCAGFYDRAALIALPPPMRQSYFSHLGRLLPAPAQGLLVTLEYDQALIDGPPFCVRDVEVRQGFAGWQVAELEQHLIAQDSPRFVAAGVRTLLERVYRLTR
ncbi:thiopurine S-methyltransferase [Pseudomonas sp. RP23018S]|uniref:thiopurine S-methyltransferase n=1 Tax=Pseudomonas sp. RP23018S TaxID=3096037 RepID=UPI002ACA08C4|nr:thiopurine S-methyltransferase [Pseudomonas sp. RP23018S]MDZ5602145.1 thiopurine S-methyltransferase [Pseudomonas sp. RP23018S]